MRILTLVLGASLLLTTAAVGGPTPPPTPTPTATPTGTPTATPTPTLIFLPRAARDVCVSVSLPDLVGEVDFFPSSGNREASFDVGLGFSEIQNVWIVVEAEVFAQEYDYCGTLFDPKPCVHVFNHVGFFAIMDKEDSPNLGSVFSWGLSFSDDENALEGYGVDVAVFNNQLVGWDFLLDGQGSLKLYWHAPAFLSHVIIHSVIDPSGEIFNARLIIEGTPVPEPAASLMSEDGILEPPGVCRRLHSSKGWRRGWSQGKHNGVFPGGPRGDSPNGH
jgi:hypothetical protein